MGTDMAPLAYYALVAAIVLALIVIVLAIAKKAMGVGSGPKVKGRGPRLAVMDVSVIDPKRKLVLVRRDEVEHLLLIGGQNDLVVEASILRGVPSARPGRTEPSLGAEDYGQRGAGQARGAAPSQVARGPSPLTRPVPRPPQPPAPPVAPVAAAAPVVVSVPDRSDPVVETPRAAPASSSLPAPNVAPPIEGPSAPKVSKDEVKPERDATVLVAPPAPIPAVEPPSAPSVAVQRPTAPVVQAPVITTPVVSPPVVSPPIVSAPVVQAPTVSAPVASAPVVAAPAASAPAVSIDPIAPPAEAQRVAPPVLPSAPVQTVAPQPPVQPAASAPVPPAATRPPLAPTQPQPPRAPQPIPPTALPRQLPREPERAPQPPAATEAGDAQRPVSLPLPRFTVGGTLEPVQRSGQATPIQPAPPSQAQPSPAQSFQAQPSAAQPFQARSMATPTLPAKPAPAAAELEAKAKRNEPNRTNDVEDEIEAAKPVGDEPSPEEVLARLLAKAKEPVRSPVEQNAAPSIERPQPAPQAPAQPAPVAPPTPRVESGPAAPSVAAPDAGDRRPLAVRSFASAIQGRQSAPETSVPAPATRREPEVVLPVPPVPPTPSSPAREATLAAAAPTRQPATTWEDEEDDLEDFLSAQLNDQLGEDIWATKEGTEAPVVQPEKPPAPPKPVESAAPTPPPAKRPLTLEEEMERLLGDFDLETSDRRNR
ncbi:hypothetical protein ASG54_12685 [Aureimonas sp. Leaf460]|nr:hypothetical protein ASG62_08820 [Aureimonas sp. Leaf427]KQT77095.1 hypothetical protein ASG54_12685 [Aureimonas sp. Leaf460]